MKHIALVFVLVALVGFTEAKASVSQEVQREQMMQATQSRLLRGQQTAVCESVWTELSCEQQIDLWLTAVEDLKDRGFHQVAADAASSVVFADFTLVQRSLLVRLLRRTAPSAPMLPELLAAIDAETQRRSLNDIETYALCEFVDPVYCRPTRTKPIVAPTREMVRDLALQWPDLSGVAGGRYAKVPRIYLFCRSERIYPCRMVVRDGRGRWVTESGGGVWSQPALAYSRHGKKFNETGGNTPSGVFLVNGVMPVADEPDSFGRFRRLILDFVPSSSRETSQKKFLPASSREGSWWNEGVIARGLGRSAFRVHGTGRLNEDRTSPHYGFFGTSGCIENRENTYDGVTYKNQRQLLDTLMAAMKLAPVYGNETSIRAVLYVINMDSAARAVSLSDVLDLVRPAEGTCAGCLL